MWVRVVKTFVYCSFLILLKLWPVQCHVPSYLSTPSSKVEQFCILAESCVHDTIAVCGRMGDDKRTFLDLCDMLEYACDTTFVFTHIDDEPGCPVDKPRR